MNTVTLTSFGDTPAMLEATFVDWAEIRYVRRLMAEAGAIRFRADETGCARIGNVSASGVIALDVTSPAKPRPLKELTVLPVAGGFEVMLEAGAGRTYAVSVIDDLLVPEGLEIVSEPRLLTDAACEYLIITTDALVESAQGFADYHQNQGRKVKVFTLSEALDTGDHGIYSPAAVQKLIHASGAGFVLLVGDMTFDYFGLYTTDVEFTIPAPFVAIRDFHSVSDIAYAMPGGKTPTVAVGRIPARTPEEVATVLGKVKARALASVYPVDLLLAAGDGQDQFQLGCEQVAPLAKGPVTKAYVKDLGIALARTQLFTSWNAGPRLVYFSGHGSTHQWANKKLLKMGDVVSLDPAFPAPVVIQLNCLSSGAQQPHFGGYGCLGEAMLFTAGGASAVIGSTAMTPPEGQGTLGQATVAAYQSGTLTIGEAFLQAQKQAVRTGLDQDVLQSFILLGDPAGE